MKKLFVKLGEDPTLSLFWNSILIGFLLLPISINPSTPFFVIAMLLGAFYNIKNKSKIDKKDLYFLCLPILWILLVISLIYTNNIKTGINLITRMIPIAIFPLLLLYIRENEDVLRKLFTMLLIGILASMAINLFLAFNNSLSIVESQLIFDASYEGGFSFYESFNHGGNHFFGTRFSNTIHPTYIALYILISLVYFGKNGIRFKYIVFAVLLVYLFLLSSRAALIVLLSYAFLFIFYFGDKKKRIGLGLLVLSAVILFIFLNPRTKTFYERIITFKEKTNYNYTTSEQSRILIYHTCMELIKKHPIMGYGIGDANDVLQEEYTANSYLTLAKKQYNAHSQFFQTLLQAGIIAFIILIVPIGLIFFKGLRNPYVLAAIIAFVILMGFESLLVRYNGIIFYAIIIPLLMRNDNEFLKNSLRQFQKL
ncbi:O-antigen ligase [Arenibacter algicola]|uniref:O-antigen ligase n=1 Tax=Arenibacter algicola TaxID=616991 RepID=A0ABY3AIN2_9FLAO